MRKKDGSASRPYLSRPYLEMSEQLPLIEAESDAALLLPIEEIRKRYTAENSKHIEYRKRVCRYLLEIQCPGKDIAELLGMSEHTVGAFAAQLGMACGGFSENFSNALMTSAAGDFALADTKKHEANYLQLTTGGAIKVDKAIAIKLLNTAPPEADAIELEAESEALKSAREFVAKMQAEKQAVK